ncbi:hypothetical protein RUND412_008592 [Rhizina undulata]
MYPGAKDQLDKELAWVFEIIHPKNVIGVRYGARKELVLLSAFRKDGVSSELGKSRGNYFLALAQIADDFGGKPWLKQKAQVWDKIQRIIEQRDRHWRDFRDTLRAEGCTHGNANDAKRMATLTERIQGNKIDPVLQNVLFAWFAGKDKEKLVDLCFQSFQLPAELQELNKTLLARKSCKK